MNPAKARFDALPKRAQASAVAAFRRAVLAQARAMSAMGDFEVAMQADLSGLDDAVRWGATLIDRDKETRAEVARIFDAEHVSDALLEATIDGEHE